MKTDSNESGCERPDEIDGITQDMPMSRILPSLQSMVERLDQIYSLDTREEECVYWMSSGYVDLDRELCGFAPGDLIVVAGRPSMGVSAFCHSIHRHVALELDKPALLFTMEHTDEQLALRSVASTGSINIAKGMSGRIYENEMVRLSEALGRLHSGKDKLFISAKGRFDVAQIRNDCMAMANRVGPPGVIVVENLQMLGGPEGFESRAVALGHCAAELKALAMDLNVPVIVASKLNRMLETRINKRPILTDMRDSGSIEDIADVVLCLYRDDLYNPDSPDKGTAEVIIAKNKNGPTGTVSLAFIAEYMKFDNLASPGLY